jgi:excisionase family DNA binding protein
LRRISARPAARVLTAIEEDAQRIQMRLPFPDEKTIDMARCCSILHISDHVVRRLSITPLLPGSELMCLSMYNTMRYAPMRIDYDSLVLFLDTLREKHGIADRRSAPFFGRYRDDDLLPFPWSDTMTVEEAADTLSLHRSKVLLRIESGLFEAYQLVSNSHWRISRSSFSKYLENVCRLPRAERPYGG